MTEYMPYFFTAVAICSAARSSASSRLDGLPLVRAAFAHALHGVQHVARAVDQVQLVQALRAQGALLLSVPFCSSPSIFTATPSSVYTQHGQLL